MTQQGDDERMGNDSNKDQHYSAVAVLEKAGFELEGGLIYWTSPFRSPFLPREAVENAAKQYIETCAAKNGRTIDSSYAEQVEDELISGTEFSDEHGKWLLYMDKVTGDPMARLDFEHQGHSARVYGWKSHNLSPQEYTIMIKNFWI